METEEKVYEIKFNMTGLAAVKAARVALGGLDKALASIGESVQEAFSVKGYRDYLQTAGRFGKNLADELLVLQLAFGKMKVAITDALAPLAELVVPVLTKAVRWVTDAARQVGGLFRALQTGGQQQIKTQENLQKSLSETGDALKRTLAGFDQIQRLDTGDGEETDTEAVVDKISPQMQALADKIRALLKPLGQIDLTPLMRAFQSLGKAVSSFASVAAAGLERLWLQVLTPFLEWVAESFGPVFASAWTEAVNLVTAVLEPLTEGFFALMGALEPAVTFLGSLAVEAAQHMASAFGGLTGVIQSHGPQIQQMLLGFAEVVGAVWQRISPVLQRIGQGFGELFGGMEAVAEGMAEALIHGLSGISDFLAGAFTGNWKRCWQGLKEFMAGVVNGILGILNGILSGLGAALNFIVDGVNSLRFTVPNWVPGIGGQSFGIDLPSVQIPQIPYLAKGAVLPANQPFLAVVGDQTHGTNVEAPLATIQEAVALVMEQQTEAILSGFQSSVGVQREILEAVLGIRIGDDVIGRATARYNRKMATARGGI